VESCGDRRRQAELAAMLGVDAPADARIAHPRVDRFKSCCAPTPNRRPMIAAAAARTRCSRQSATSPPSAAPAAPGHRGCDGLVGRPVIVYGIWRAGAALPNTASISGAGCLQVGRHHQDIGRPRRLRAGQQHQQLVVQNLELARQRMAHMDFDAAVARRKREASAPQIGEVQHGVLHPREQRPASTGREVGVGRPARCRPAAAGRCGPGSAGPRMTSRRLPTS